MDDSHTNVLGTYTEEFVLFHGKSLLIDGEPLIDIPANQGKISELCDAGGGAGWEMYEKMSTAQNWYFNFPSFYSATRIFAIRQNVIRTMKAYNANIVVSYPDPSPLVDYAGIPQCGDTVWVPTDPQYPYAAGEWSIPPSPAAAFWEPANDDIPPSLSFHVISGKSRHTAMSSYIPLYGDCRTAIDACYFKAAAMEMDAGDFDTKFSGIFGIGDAYQGPFFGDEDPNTVSQSLLKLAFDSTYPTDVVLIPPLSCAVTAIPGDYVYMQNKWDYSEWHDVKKDAQREDENAICLGTGENCVYLGCNAQNIGLFAGLGMVDMTEEEIASALIQMYHDELILVPPLQKNGVSPVDPTRNDLSFESWNYFLTF